MVVDDLVGEGDKVARRWTLSGTHKSEYQGIPPTNKKIVSSGNNIFRIADYKVAEIWSRYNALGMMQQIGVIPPMGARKK
jgi:predicted ester cyclase